MASVISVANMKGGVGKTTLCVSLSEGLCFLEKHVLVVDLDAQTNCSQILWGKRQEDPWKDGENIHGFLCSMLTRSNIESFPYIKRHIIANEKRTGSISLFCGSPLLFSLERRKLSEFNNGIRQLESIYERAIKRVYEREQENFDFIIFDCPPGISLLAEAALKTSDLIIIPTAPSFLSTMGIQAFSEFLISNTSADRYVFINQVNNTARKMAKYRREIVDELKHAQPRYRVFRNYYTQRVAFQRALERYDGASFSKRYGDVGMLVKNVVEEVIEAVNGKPISH
jgi:chromosome partitioning protein